MPCPEIICYERKWPECIQWNGRKGGRDKKELGKRDKGGKMVTDQRRPQASFCGRGRRRSLYSRTRRSSPSPRSLSLPSQSRTHQCHHCIGKSRSLSSVYLSEQPNTSFGATKSRQHFAGPRSQLHSSDMFLYH